MAGVSRGITEIYASCEWLERAIGEKFAWDGSHIIPNLRLVPSARSICFFDISVYYLSGQHPSLSDSFTYDSDMAHHLRLLCNTETGTESLTTASVNIRG